MRVLEVNIWARSGPYPDREPRLRQLFADLAPDLIAMQEVDIGDETATRPTSCSTGLGTRSPTSAAKAPIAGIRAWRSPRVARSSTGR
jgi:hypothetical protein